MSPVVLRDSVVFANSLAGGHESQLFCSMNSTRMYYRERSPGTSSGWRAKLARINLSQSTFRCTNGLPRIKFVSTSGRPYTLVLYERSVALNLTGALLSAGIPFFSVCYLWSPSFAFGLRTTLRPPSMVFSRRHEESRKETSAQECRMPFPCAATNWQR